MTRSIDQIPPTDPRYEPPRPSLWQILARLFKRLFR